VAGALADAAQRPRIVRLAVRDMPMSGEPAELLHAAGIDAEAIVGAVRALNSAGR
jgi:transketolase